MSDLALEWGGDLTLSATGDLAAVSGSGAVRQRVELRLLTFPLGMIWHADYGAGVGGAVGEPVRMARIRGQVLQQLRLEQAVAASPAPKVEVTAEPGGTVLCQIQYWDKATGQAATIRLPVGL